jgi:N-acetylmuramoyl-L-alanine amidase
MRRALALAVASLAFAGAAALAQGTLPVVFLNDSTRSPRVGAFERPGVTYVSLDHLARVFVFDSFVDTAMKRYEWRTGPYTIAFSENNRFVVISDSLNNGNIVQLPAPILAPGRQFFGPAAQMAQLLDHVLPDRIAYDLGRIVVGTPVTASSRYDITGLGFEEKTNGYLVRVRCARKLSDYETWLKTDGTDTWLYMTLANARADVSAINRIQASGFVKKILVFQSPTAAQLTIRLKGNVSTSETMASETGEDILVALQLPSAQQIARKKQRDYERALERERQRWKLDVVVIDAGHGGDDPGTIGVTKTKEKDITLGIALKLGRLIERSIKDVKVVYTRTTDRFVELYRRGQIANQANGKLFLSIHCNAMPRRAASTNGFEIYLLRPGKTENAIRIAERENSVIELEEGYENRYEELTEENFILLTMAQSAYMKYSESFANILQQEMGRRSGVDNNGVKQAGFLVLVGASMPNVLIETAYLSNRHDEKVLKSASGQQRFAEAIFQAVKRYKTEYEKSLEEGKDLGAAGRR